ncbi:MAG: SUMF1/EgtB/PvdO family nonheme iron enzyme, partial [Candidatus ainarchaeum sp.]|nr:SUMF1/EgtB/PvdO family nonheme iron enzyme [Candidatus ainarchaeum sp.]
ITKTGMKTTNRQPRNCPEGFIPVPGNFLYDTTNDSSMGFCVAKYEMKADKDGDGIGDLVSDYPAMTSTYNTWYFSEDSNITLVSTPEGSPIANIKQTEAITACESIGGHLITNNEWMTLARNIELVPSNWSGGVVGDGYIYSGHNDRTLGGALEASVDTNGYAGTGQSSGNQRRTLTLTNGEVIWDLAGNVREWTNDSIALKDQPDGFNDVDDSIYTGGQWFDYSKGGGVGRYITSDNLGDTTLEYKDLFLLTSNKYNADNNGVGRISTSSNDTSTSPRVFLRGGSWYNSSNSGLLALYLFFDSGHLSYSFGLRCAVVP